MFVWVIVALHLLIENFGTNVASCRLPVVLVPPVKELNQSAKRQSRLASSKLLVLVSDPAQDLTARRTKGCTE